MTLQTIPYEFFISVEENPLPYLINGFFSITLKYLEEAKMLWLILQQQCTKTLLKPYGPLNIWYSK
jgi:hypothetical protein